MANYTESPDAGCGTAAPPCPRSDRLGSRSYPGAPGPRRRTTSSSPSSRSSGRSTAAISTRRACSGGCPRRASASCRGRARTQAFSISATGSRSRSRSSRTTIPSAVEPYEGAATGIGGILRDIVAVGARPIALLDGLWFGAPDHHFERAVAGIGNYGNSVGVANVGGATVFDEAYRGNCLVNAMCVGLLDAAAAAVGEGARAGEPRRALRRDHRARRHRRRVRARQPGARRGRSRQAALGASRRSVHRQEADRGVDGARGVGTRRVAAGLRRRGSGLRALRDGARRRRPRRPPRPRAAPRVGDGAVGDRHLRVAGADGRRRPPADARGRPRGCARSGSFRAP